MLDGLEWVMPSAALSLLLEGRLAGDTGPLKRIERTKPLSRPNLRPKKKGRTPLFSWGVVSKNSCSKHENSTFCFYRKAATKRTTPRVYHYN